MTVLATSTPVTIAKEKAIEDGDNPRSNLEQVLCIHYPINFKEKFVLAVFDSSNKVDAVYPTFTKKIGLSIRSTDVGAQKIDGTTVDSYEKVVIAFLIMDKANRVRFFEKTFLMANISPEIVFGMPFLTLSSTNIDFLD